MLKLDCLPVDYWKVEPLWSKAQWKEGKHAINRGIRTFASSSVFSFHIKSFCHVSLPQCTILLQAQINRHHYKQTSLKIGIIINRLHSSISTIRLKYTLMVCRFRDVPGHFVYLTNTSYLLGGLVLYWVTRVLDRTKLSEQKQNLNLS